MVPLVPRLARGISSLEGRAFFEIDLVCRGKAVRGLWMGRRVMEVEWKLERRERWKVEVMMI